MSMKDRVFEVLKEVGEPVHVEYVAVRASPEDPKKALPHIRVALFRLCRSGKARRVDRGVYVVKEG